MPSDLDPLFARFQAALAGRYSLERELGRGGMGVVYLAHEVRLERPVAIKLLPPHLAGLPELREGFLREARTAARLSHPNIVPIHAVDDIGEFVYFAMAYVPGETLARRVESRGPLQGDEAARILREVAWALAYSHSQGVVHRDIKPENVLLEQGTGRALVADFGIATVERAGPETVPGQVMGTPEFMSPEQASGDPVDGRSDLYALGALGFYLFTGKPPFQGPGTARLLSQHLTAPVPSLAAAAPGLPAPLVQLLERCLAKEPDQRPQTGAQLADELGLVLQADRGPGVELRAYVRRFRVLFLTASLVGAGPLILTTYPAGLTFRDQAITGGLIWLAITVAFVIQRTDSQLRQLRGLGYTPDEVAEAADAMTRSRREEDDFLAGWDPTRSPGAAWGSLVLFAFLFSVAAFDAVAGSQTLSLADLFFLFVFGAGLVAQIRAIQIIRRPAESRVSLTGRFWRSGLVRWWWRRIGGGTVQPSASPSHRPTEVRLAQSVDELFASLPVDVKRDLKGLLPLVRRLETRARQIRKQIEELERLSAEAGRRPLLPPTGETREAVVAELSKARERTEGRLEGVVAAIETIRLSLLRLRAGAGTVEGMTADLTAAEAIAAHADRQLAGLAEMDLLLKNSPFRQ